MKETEIIASLQAVKMLLAISPVFGFIYFILWGMSCLGFDLMLYRRFWKKLASNGNNVNFIKYIETTTKKINSLVYPMTKILKDLKTFFFSPLCNTEISLQGWTFWNICA